MGNDVYTSPTVETVAKDPVPEVAAPVAEVPVKVTTKPAPNAPMSNVDFFQVSLDEFFKYVNREVGFKDDAERNSKNITFIELVGRMVCYEYSEFEDCTLRLIKKLKESDKSLKEGTLHRFLEDLLQVGYSANAIDQYRTYTSWLARIAMSWQVRVKLAQQTEVQTLTKNMRKEAKANVLLFIRKMANWQIVEKI